MKITLVALLAGSVLLAAPAVYPASAQLSGLSVTDASRTLGPNDTLDAVRLDLSADYEFASTHELTAVVVEVYVRQPSGSYTLLDSLTIDTPGTNGTGTVDLSGNLDDTAAFTLADFDAAQGQTTTQQVDVKIVLKLLRNGDRVGVADASSSAQVSVTREEMTVSGTVSGSGGITVVAS